MYRKLNPSGAEPREISDVVNNLVDGKSNNAGSVTLNSGGATQTIIYNERIGYDSVITLNRRSSSSISYTLPYGKWKNLTTQSAASTAVAYLITYDTTDYTDGIALVGTSQLTAGYSGLYNLQYKLQLSSLSTSTAQVAVWFRKNGVNIDSSTSLFGMSPRRNATDPFNTLASMNLFIELAKNDYVEVVWNTTDILVTIPAAPATTNPDIPRASSATTTMQYISANGYTQDTFNTPYISSQSKGFATITHASNSFVGVNFDYMVVA